MFFKKFSLYFVLFILLFPTGCAQHNQYKFKKGLNKHQDAGLYNIMGKGKATEQMMFDYMRQYNKKIASRKLTYIVKTYIWESDFEGVNHDVAFVQMCHETNFLKFGGAVTANQNNFCGLGTLNYDISGACFFSIKDGIRAHVQHLKAYGSRAQLNGECIDPRFDLIPRSSAKNVYELTGKWAMDVNYGKALEKKMNSLLKIGNKN